MADRTVQFNQLGDATYYTSHTDEQPALDKILSLARESYIPFMNNILTQIRAGATTAGAIDRGFNPFFARSSDHADYQPLRTITVSDPDTDSNTTVTVQSILDNNLNPDEFLLITDTFVINPAAHTVTSSTQVEGRHRTPASGDTPAGSYESGYNATSTLSTLSPLLSDYALGRLTNDQNRLAYVRGFILPVADLLSDSINLGITPTSDQAAIQAAVASFTDENITFDATHCRFESSARTMVCEVPLETECAPEPAQVCLSNETPVCVDPTIIDVEVATLLLAPLAEIAGLPTIEARNTRFAEIQAAAYENLVFNISYNMSSGATVLVSEDEARRLVEESFRNLTGFAYNDILRDVFQEEPDGNRWWNVPLKATVPPVATSTGAVDTNPPTNVTISPATLSAGPLPQITLTAGAGSFAAGSTVRLIVNGDLFDYAVPAQSTTFVIQASASATLATGSVISFYYQAAPGVPNRTPIGPVITVP